MQWIEKLPFAYIPFGNIKSGVKAVICVQSQVQVEEVAKMMIKVANCESKKCNG